MKLLNNKRNQKLLIFIASLIVSVSLSLRILLSLPFFYEQTPSMMAIILVIFILIFVAIILSTNRLLILSHSNCFRNWKNIALIALLSVILITSFAVSSNHYWSKPEIHRVEICFDAKKGNQPLIINKLFEPKTNRMFSPRTFGFGHYPIVVQSGDCLSGQMITLYWGFPLRLILKNMKVVVDKEPPEGRLFISVNEVPAVVYFDNDAEEPIKTGIFFTEGFDKGTPLSFSRNKYIYLGIKSIALIISSLYLAFVLFGFTEIFLKSENKFSLHKTDRN